MTPHINRAIPPANKDKKTHKGSSMGLFVNMFSIQNEEHHEEHNLLEGDFNIIVRLKFHQLLMVFTSCIKLSLVRHLDSCI